MDSALRRSYHEVRQALEEALARPGADGSVLSADIWAVQQVLDGSTALRRNLADPSREGADRATLAERLLQGKIGDLALHVVKAAVSQRWSEPGALLEALESAGVESELAHAEAHGRLAQVEDELFRFERIVRGETELQAALTDRRADPAAKAALVERLLAVRASPETVRLAHRAVVGTRGRRFDRALTAYLEQAAQRQQRLTAVVTSAVPLSPEQEQALTEALSRKYGHQIAVHPVVDQSVVGGLRVEIGDDVIDGTVSHRLADARRRMTAG